MKRRPPAPPARNPFDAVPMVPDNVEAQSDPEGRIVLTWHRVPTSSLGRWVERRFGWRQERRVHLDEAGSHFWCAIDGTRSLHAIARRLERQLAIDPEEARRATFAFTASLMKRNLIVLRVLTPAPSKSRPQHARP